LLDSSQIERMKLHIHGIINHGLKLRQLYSSHNYWKHGADYVVSIFHQHLSDLKESIAAEK
jgi:hypothetical protein